MDNKQSTPPQPIVSTIRKVVRAARKRKKDKEKQ